MGRPKGTRNVMRSAEEKERLIQECYASYLSKERFAASHGIDERLFRQWVSKYEKNGLEGLKSQSGKSGSGNHFAALYRKKDLSEIERLRLENMRKDIEIARLKKGYFVKGAGSKKEYVSIKKRNTK